jgi:hypothetical protein
LKQSFEKIKTIYSCLNFNNMKALSQNQMESIYGGGLAAGAIGVGCLVYSLG